MTDDLLAAVNRAIEDGLRRQTDELRRMVDVLRLDIANLEWRSRRSLSHAADLNAAATSAAYLHEHMRGAEPMPHRRMTFDRALELADGVDGMALEFGVLRGASLTRIAQARPGGGVYGFDSFDGLPEFWMSGYDAGRFGPDDPIGARGVPEVPGAELVPGWFDDTVPGWAADHQGDVAFLHVDCDLYSSTRTVLEHVGPRLRPGSVVVFDEYFNYPNWQEHEYRAWQEHVERTGLEYSYRYYTEDALTVVVRIESV